MFNLLDFGNGGAHEHSTGPAQLQQASPIDVNPSQSERIDPYQGRSDFEGRHILNLGGSVAVPRMAGFGASRSLSFAFGTALPAPQEPFVAAPADRRVDQEAAVRAEPLRLQFDVAATMRSGRRISSCSHRFVLTHPSAAIAGSVSFDRLGVLKGKDVLLGVIDVASDRVETPEEVAATIEQASRFVPVERIYPCTNCGMAPMDRSLAVRKLVALSAGAAVARSRFESTRR